MPLSDYGQDHPGMGVFCSDKNGTGVMVLNNVNGFTGTTIVTQGILDLRND